MWGAIFRSVEAQRGKAISGEAVFRDTAGHDAAGEGDWNGVRGLTVDGIGEARPRRGQSGNVRNRADPAYWKQKTGRATASD
jgi:hypothetical protein